jgi:outer membrane protein OmpA-like peptidoglycan-associated protein
MRGIKRLIVVVTALVLILSLSSWGMEMTRKFSVGVDAGLWKPMLTENMDIWTIGYQGTFTFKYGVKENLALGFMGKYAKTWEAKLDSPDEDAGFTFDKKTDGWENLEYLCEGALYYFFNPENEKYTPYIFGGGGVAFWKWEETFDTDTTDLVTRVVRWPAKKGSGADSVRLEDQELTLVFGAGVEYYPKENLGVNLGARVRYFTRLLTGFINDKDIVGTDQEMGELDLPRVTPEIYLGVSYYFGKPKDTDEDGVPDKLDNCADTPLGAMVDENGCPLDSDEDGVYDGLDNCGATPKGAIVDVNGCPTDSDGDGVFDGIDKCEDTPSGWPVDAQGCPLDDDGDGVPNPVDKEADTPAGAVVDENGMGIDSDNDGVYDGVDKCPDTYMGIPVDKDGCPLIKPIEPKIVLHPAYPSGSAVLDDETKVFLDDLAGRLIAYKTVRIEIRGYTDSWGTPEGNKWVSQRRADVIKKYLVAKGVEEERIETKGYGATEFIADNKTAEGRAENRRIEIVTIP